MHESSCQGMLCIGDPHLASRVPGFRKDDYARAILGKLRWALAYARSNNLLPLLLGDLFHWPQDNANWLVVQLLDVLKLPVLAIAGNHDCSENALSENDTLSVLTAAGCIHLLDASGPWSGTLNGTRVLIGGTAWNQRLPETLAPVPESSGSAARPLVFWLSHHDLYFPGYEDSARYKCREIPGIDVVINGHIHRPLGDVVCGSTTYLNPGNIARVSRTDASRARKPSVLRIDVNGGGWSRQVVEVPHEPFDAVFHAEVVSADVQLDDSLFVRGLAALESLKTGGAGLWAFLNENLHQFDEPVAREIRALAEEVLRDGDQSN